MPSAWQSHDVGNVALSGKTILANGNFTVCGTGTGIGGAEDSFHYLHDRLSGDGSIEAYVDSVLERGNSKAGLMIRDTLDAGATHASIFLTEAGNAVFEYRSTAGETTQAVTQAGIQAPYWLKLERQGNVLTGYYSEDGQSWTSVSGQSVAMNPEAHLGLAVSSQDNSTYCDTIFKQVAVNNDSDNDLLQDNWERSFFGDLATSNGDSTNNDHDQHSDLEEFIFVTVPTDPQSFFDPAISSADEGYLQITFDAAAGRSYTLEVSETLSPESWSPVRSVSPESNGQQVLDYTHPDTPPRLFGRIRASK